MTPRVSGFAALVAVFVFDQITKFWAYSFLQGREGNFLEVFPFFNLVTTWNRGISFGLFNHGDPLPPAVFIALSIAISAIFALWLWRSGNNPLAAALGCVIGGALGNVIDRFRFGAVFDFLDFHALGWHWPAFNIADSAIVLGIAYVLIDGLFFEPKRKGTSLDVQKT